MRDFDIIVYGATGFTGRLVAEYLVAGYPAPTAAGRWRGARSPSWRRCAT